MAEKIRWGILSTAKIGKTRVIPAMQESNNGEVVAVASRNLEKAQAFADELGIPKAYGSYEELIESGEVDAIYNPLPNSEHATWSIKCAEAGIPTLCEKPLASDAEESQMMVNAFSIRGVLFAEAFMYRFHPQSQRVKQLIEDGEIGDVKVVSASFTFPLDDMSNIRLSKELAGGSLMDVGCYCVNVSRFMTGEEPDDVKAFARVGEESGVDETQSAVLSFPSGAVAHIDSSLKSHFANTYEVRGTKGRIQVPEGFVMNKDAETVIHVWREGKYEAITIPPANSYTIMAEDFADSLINNRPPKFAPNDGVANMRVIDQIYQSAGVK